MKAFRLAGWIALIVTVAGVVANYPDIRRYIKIESM
jgi:hypothetical protein